MDLSANIKNNVNNVKNRAVGVDFETVKRKAQETGEALSEKAAELKESALSVKEDISKKLLELDHMLEQSITDYNDAVTQMNDKGMKLYVERCRATDCIANVEHLVNSITNHPKSFDADFEEIKVSRQHFTDSCEFAEREIKAARAAAGNAGVGLAAGTTVAFMAPSAAMWIATTFGTASTGTAISTLSGAAASQAALAWLGGGALSAGGGGVAAGHALLALAGPIGWTVAGASLLTAIVLFTSKKVKLNKEKNQEIDAVKTNTAAVLNIDQQILNILQETEEIRIRLNDLYLTCLVFYNNDYRQLHEEQRQRLGMLVNNTKTLSALFEKTVS